MIDANKSEMIQLTFLSDPDKPDEQGHLSDVCIESDSSSNLSDLEGAEFDHPETCVGATKKNNQQIRALKLLHLLQSRLRRAILHADSHRRHELVIMHMPVLEALIHELTRNGGKSKACDIPGLEDVAFLKDPCVRKRSKKLHMEEVALNGQKEKMILERSSGSHEPELADDSDVATRGSVTSLITQTVISYRELRLI